MSRRKFVKKSTLAAAGFAMPFLINASAEEERVEAATPLPVPFQADWKSLAKYQCPEWFRDAKFGIWAHWSAQCVPEQGDWYARGMYEQKLLEGFCAGQYDYQCSHYGHPSKVGFKDIDHLWKAEHWEPEVLLDLYQKAGAKYFVALANHHDNFDTWNSRYQPWNSVNIGPRQDILGAWAKAARKRGMRFGVSVHANRTWDWFDVSHGSDSTGPLAGVPYDGTLTRADGKGTWWEGYDPAELYGPAGAARTDAARAAYERKFYNRVMDLLDQHRPDLLYFDDGEPPTAYGLEIVANYYNRSRQWHGGSLQAVLNVKNESGRVKRSMVLDYERSSSDRIARHPWQTDTCIGQWHYRRSIYENHQYKTPAQVVRMLVDIVAKNGNLLLSVPLRGDGTIDPDERSFLEGMAAWMAVNSESIFATRPWKIAGEGATQSKGDDDSGDALTSSDFRFVTKSDVLYATTFGWPEDRTLIVRTLAADAPGIHGTIRSVHLLGAARPLPFTRTAEGLVVTLPEQKPCDHAWALKIIGLDLTTSDPTPLSPLVQADADGALTLTPASAALHGSLHTQSGAQANIGFWNDPEDSVSWRVAFPKAGHYTVSAQIATGDGATAVAMAVDQGPAVTLPVPLTNDWNGFQAITGGPLIVPSAGVHTVTV